MRGLVRAYILSRESRLTRGNVVRLAKLAPKEMKKYLEELMKTGKRPRKERRASRTITLPREPKTLAEKLLKQLVDKGAKAVAAALAEMMKE